jgi:hypothetical protein
VPGSAPGFERLPVVAARGGQDDDGQLDVGPVRLLAGVSQKLSQGSILQNSVSAGNF